MAIYYDAPGAKAGGVTVLVNAHYVPENGFLKGGLINILKTIGVAEIIEDEDPTEAEGKLLPNTSAWDKLQASISRLKEMIEETKTALGENSVHLLSSIAELDAALLKYDLVIINGIEGAHHLGRYLSTTEDYISKLKFLKEQGFCVFTLSHFFLNDICDTAGGIPQSDLAITNYQVKVATAPGLTKIGVEVVKWCLQNGILIDLVHSTRETRQAVYQINNELAGAGIISKPRPLAFTHTGVRDFYRRGSDATYESLNYLPDIEDIRAINACNGIMGIILMNNWLKGEDSDDPDLEIVLNTIKYISDHAGGNFNNIGIGTDLDGFTHVPDNLNQSAKLGILSQAIVQKFGDMANQILYWNAYRVLKEACS